MRYFFFILSFLVFACQHDREQPGIPDEKMAHIMAEIAIADGATNMLSGFKKDSLANAYYRQVMEMNGVTVEEYEKSLRIIVDDVPHIEKIVKMAEEMIRQKKGPVPEESEKKPNQ